MRTIRRFVVALALLVAGRDAAAEVPPHSVEELTASSDLIVTGTVTTARLVGPTRGDDIRAEYTCELTVRVSKVEKGVCEVGQTLAVRGDYFALRPGIAGKGGHYSDGDGYMLPSVDAGWELTLYLYPSKDGMYGIVDPNGFRVLSTPPGRSVPRYGAELLDYLPGIGGAIVAAALVVIAFVAIRKLRRRANAAQGR